MARSKDVGEGDHCNFCGKPLNGERTWESKLHKACYNKSKSNKYREGLMRITDMSIDELFKVIDYNNIKPLKVPLKEMKNWDMMEQEER